MNTYEVELVASVEASEADDAEDIVLEALKTDPDVLDAEVTGISEVPA